MEHNIGHNLNKDCGHMAAENHMDCSMRANLERHNNMVAVGFDKALDIVFHKADAQPAGVAGFYKAKNRILQRLMSLSNHQVDDSTKKHIAQKPLITKTLKLFFLSFH